MTFFTAKLGVTPWKIKGEVPTGEKPVILLGNSAFKSLKNVKSYEQQLPCEDNLKEGHTLVKEHDRIAKIHIVPKAGVKVKDIRV